MNMKMSPTDTAVSHWNLLMIDDDEDDYFLVREMLTNAHGKKCSVVWANNYETGRQMLFQNQYHAVLVDYDLGLHTGLELIREASSKDYPSPLILYTGRGNYEVDLEAMQAGATLYLSKNEANALLLERIIRYAIELKEKEVALLERETNLRQARNQLEQELAVRKQAESVLARNAERQTLLLDVTRALISAGSNLPSLAEAVFDRVRAYLDVDVLFNYRIESPDGPLKLVAGFGIPDPFVPGSQRLELGQAFCGTVALTRQPLVANADRIRTDEKGAFVRGMGVTAYACHPLFSRDGKVMGTLSLCSTRRMSFSAEEVSFIQTLCHYVAMAWEHTQSEEALRKHLAQHEAMDQRALWFSQITDQDPNPVICAAEDGKILYSNPAAKDVFAGDWTDHRLPEALAPTIRQAFNLGKAVHTRLSLGPRTFSFSVYPFPEKGYANIYGSAIPEASRQN